MTCAVEGCDKPTKARGLCASHYVKYWKSDDFVYTPNTILGKLDNETLKKLSGFLE